MESADIDAFLFVSDMMPMRHVRDIGSCTYVKVWEILRGYKIPTMG
jgi:hypothetical protein